MGIMPSIDLDGRMVFVNCYYMLGIYWVIDNFCIDLHINYIIFGMLHMYQWNIIKHIDQYFYLKSNQIDRLYMLHLFHSFYNFICRVSIDLMKEMMKYRFHQDNFTHTFPHINKIDLYCMICRYQDLYKKDN